MSRPPQEDWSSTTWQGSRRAQLRAALKLTVRERLLAMQELAELSDRLAAMRRIPAAPTDGKSPR